MHLLVDDLPASRRYRAFTLEQYELFASVIPDHSSLVTRGITRDAAGPLLLHRNVVIVDSYADQGGSLPTLIHELQNQGRRVFVDSAGFPQGLMERISQNVDVVVRVEGKDPIVELQSKPSG